MKTYDEMKDNVFRRMDEYEADKKCRRRLYKRTAAAACPLCAAGAAVFALWGGGVLGSRHDAPGTYSQETMAGGEKYAVIYNSDITTETINSAASDVIVTEKNTDAADSSADKEVQTVTADKENSGTDVPDEKTDTEEKTTDAPKVTTAAVTNSAEGTAAAPTTAAAAPPANLWCIFGSSISYNGAAYHDSDIIWSPYFTQDRYIGKVRDFAGTYGENINYRINPDDSVYTVKESSELLLVVKADSSSVYGSVIPMCSQNFQYDSYDHGSLVPNLEFSENSDGSPAVYNGSAHFIF